MFWGSCKYLCIPVEITCLLLCLDSAEKNTSSWVADLQIFFKNIFKYSLRGSRRNLGDLGMEERESSETVHVLSITHCWSVIGWYCMYYKLQTTRNLRENLCNKFPTIKGKAQSVFVFGCLNTHAMRAVSFF